MHKLTHYTATFCLLFLLLGKTARAQDFFAIDTIRDVEINFYDANWDYLLDSLAMLNAGTGSGTERILAQVIIDGNSFDSCGVRYKGNSSMDTASFKNPFNIDLNWVIPGQRYLGKNKIKLANCYTDPSMVREALTYELANLYMDCPHAGFARVTVNGDYLGIYTNTESVDNEFLDIYYGSSVNPFFKCDPVNFDLAGGNSNLSYHADILAYDTLYDMKSLTGQLDLQELCYNLENNIANIEDYLDVDRALWFLAVSSAYVHNDGYSAFGHNYYVYKMDNGRWSIVLWDVNMSFGGLLWNGTNWLPLGLNALQTQDPYLHEANFALKPLIAQLLSIPRYKRMYTAHHKTIMEETVSNGLYLQRAEFMSDLIDADVQNEPYSEYTYQQITDNIYNDIGAWTSLRPGLENLMLARDLYIAGLPEFQALQPTITNVTPSTTQPQAFSMVTITANVSDAGTVLLGYRNSHFDVFTKVPMYDDGLNNDGAAGDGVYGATVTIGGTDMEYYIYAENASAAKFSPVRAEYEFYILSPEKGVVLNELCAINNGIAPDQSFEYDDWIELYNNSTTTVSLAGYHLSDNLSNPTKWAFPDTVINPGEYLIVWADEDTLQAGLHTNFSLSSVGEGLYFYDNFGALADQVSYPLQLENITFGRYGNGLGSFMYLYPTFNAMNTTPVGLDENSLEAANLFPNPASGQTTLQFAGEVETKLHIHDMTGKVVLVDVIANSSQYIFDVTAFEPGMYFLTTDSGVALKFIVE